MDDGRARYESSVVDALEKLRAEVDALKQRDYEEREVLKKAKDIRACWRGDRVGLAAKMTALCKAVEEMEDR